MLADRLAKGPPVLIDGGTGTEIERMGAVMHPTAWSARAALAYPDIVRSVHRRFLDAGAELVIANTYAANYHVMAASGLAHEFEEANSKALALALEARREYQRTGFDRPVWVAGSMSTTTFSAGLNQAVLDSGGNTSEGYRSQAAIIADAGVDLIVLEMMRDVAETRLCMKAALETKLPVWLGFSVQREGDAALTLYGSHVPFSEAARQVLSESPPLEAVGIMHSQLELTSQALEELQSVWSGPLFAYPHHGVFEMPHWRFDNTLSAEEFAHAALAWVDAGAAAVGGCCGIRADHIAALRRHLERLNES